MKKYDTKKYCTNKAEPQILKHRAILQYWLQYENNPLSVFFIDKVNRLCKAACSIIKIHFFKPWGRLQKDPYSLKAAMINLIIRGFYYE